MITIMEDAAPYNVGATARLSQQERAILHLLTDPLFDRLLRPLCIAKTKPARHLAVAGHELAGGIDAIKFKSVNPGVLSGGENAALSWAYAIWCDEYNPDFRDPFAGFTALGLKTQNIIIEAMRIRHDMDRTPSQWEMFEP